MSVIKTINTSGNLRVFTVMTFKINNVLQVDDKDVRSENK